MGKNKALAHHTSTHVHTRRVSIQLSCFRSPTLAGAPFGFEYVSFRLHRNSRWWTTCNCGQLRAFVGSRKVITQLNPTQQNCFGCRWALLYVRPKFSFFILVRSVRLRGVGHGTYRIRANARLDIINEPLLFTAVVGYHIRNGTTHWCPNPFTGSILIQYIHT